MTKKVLVTLRPDGDMGGVFNQVATPIDPVNDPNLLQTTIGGYVVTVRLPLSDLQVETILSKRYKEAWDYVVEYVTERDVVVFTEAELIADFEAYLKENPDDQ